MNTEELRKRATEHQRAGRWPEAGEVYAQILQTEPGDVEAVQMLAVAEHRAGKTGQAEGRLRKAIADQAGVAGFHNTLGTILAECGRVDEAVTEIRRASELAGEDPFVLHNLGNVLTRVGSIDEAITTFERAIRIRGNLGPLYSSLGNALRAKGKLAEAVGAYRRSIETGFSTSAVHYNLGVALHALGRLEEAVGAFRRAVELRPNYPEAYSNLGVTLQESGRTGEAVGAFARAAELKPGEADFQANLGCALRDAHRTEEAIAAFARAVGLKSEEPAYHRMLADALERDGRVDEADRALERAPKSAFVASDILFSLYRREDYDSRRIFEAHDVWDRNYARALGVNAPPHRNERTADRRLRLGYVGYELGNHPHGRLLLPILENHDRSAFEPHIYCETRFRDRVDDRLATLATWHNTRAVRDAELAQQIRADGIDVLVDLQMHVARPRLLTFARRPAPVQVTYMAYCGTTGLKAMDYRLSDPILDPPGQDDAAFYSERTVRLPRCFWCYPAPPEAPDAGEAPITRNGYVTFGSFNRFSKFTPPVWRAWGELLRRVHGARLALVCPRGESRRQVIEWATQEGIEPQRVEFLDPASLPVYFDYYRRIDVALDPFPFPGGVTTMDALWMGVPVVSLHGSTAVSRGGLTILSNVGLPDLAAASVGEYLAVAQRLTEEVGRIVGMRQTLRERMRSCGLMDAARFTREIEDAFRGMWREWCEHGETAPAEN